MMNPSSQSTTSNGTFSKPSPKNGERHSLSPHQELRLEVPSHTTVTLTLLSGSAEIFGAEMATLTSDPSKQSYLISGPAKLAVFTWHGCVLDVDVEFGKELEISYTSDETVANVAHVNTHAQLEAMRDEAMMEATGSGSGEKKVSGDAGGSDGPRVLVVGPTDSGKTSLVKVLTSYAVKLGRTPILVDLDTSINMLSVPGTIAASPVTLDSMTPLANANCSIFPSTIPLVFWNGSLDLSVNIDLYKAQLDQLGKCINERNDGNESHILDARSSGIIVNGCGWIDDEGYKLMLHTVKALKINVVLVMGHDRLYSMLNSHYNKLRDAEDADMEASSMNETIIPKVIKLPRSGGIVSRDGSFRRLARSLCIRKYFYGEYIRNPVSTSMEEMICPPFSSLIHQFTPTRLEIPFADLTLYKLSSVSLSASMLPVSAKQATDPVQLAPVDISPSLHHGILAVCHPNAAEAFRNSGEARDLYLSGISGVVAVEKVNMDREMISLLSPGGSLPSNILLVGDVTWME